MEAGSPEETSSRRPGAARGLLGDDVKACSEVTCCTREDLNSAGEARRRVEVKVHLPAARLSRRGAARSAQAGRGGAAMVEWEARVTRDTTLTWDSPGG